MTNFIPKVARISENAPHWLFKSYQDMDWKFVVEKKPAYPSHTTHFNASWNNSALPFITHLRSTEADLSMVHACHPVQTECWSCNFTLIYQTFSRTQLSHEGRAAIWSILSFWQTKIPVTSLISYPIRMNHFPCLSTTVSECFATYTFYQNRSKKHCCARIFLIKPFQTNNNSFISSTHIACCLLW